MGRIDYTDRDIKELPKGMTRRSDGTLKLYSLNKHGKLLTVTFAHDGAQWNISEVKVF